MQQFLNRLKSEEGEKKKERKEEKQRAIKIVIERVCKIFETNDRLSWKRMKGKRVLENETVNFFDVDLSKEMYVYR